MKEQDIADFETDIRKVCEQYREKLPHATLAGTLDTVKTSYHLASIQNFEEATPVKFSSPPPVRIKK